MDAGTTVEIINSAERAALLALSVHEHLVLKGESTLAREVYVIYLEASGSAIRMADKMQVEVRVR